MSFVAAICTQCGANIEVDVTKEAGICKYCKTAFITEKAINNFNINNIYNIQNANFINPEKNIDNLRKLAAEEYQHGKYSSADNYYRKILEIHGNDYECLLGRFLCLTREKNDPYHNSYLKDMLEKLPDYITRVSMDDNLSYNKKNEKVDFACKECQDIIMKNYVKGRDSCFVGNGLILKEPVGIYSITTICGNTFRAFFNLFDVLEVWIDKYDAIRENWKSYCLRAEVTMEFGSRQYKCVDGNKYGKSESGAQRIYEDAQKLKKYALKVNSNYVLPSELIPTSEGGKGIDIAKGGCYIATCIYGSYNCPQVWTLRRFRDYTLNETWYGRIFIKCYYVISPRLVKWFGEKKWFKEFWKFKLDKMIVRLNREGFKDTYYEDIY